MRAGRAAGRSGPREDCPTVTTLVRALPHSWAEQERHLAGFLLLRSLRSTCFGAVTQVLCTAKARVMSDPARRVDDAGPRFESARIATRRTEGTCRAPVPFRTPFILPSDKVTGMTDVGPLYSRAGSRSGAVVVAPCQSFCATPVAAPLLCGAYDTILRAAVGRRK